MCTYWLFRFQPIDVNEELLKKELQSWTVVNLQLLLEVLYKNKSRSPTRKTKSDFIDNICAPSLSAKTFTNDGLQEMIAEMSENKLTRPKHDSNQALARRVKSVSKNFLHNWIFWNINNNFYFSVVARLCKYQKRRIHWQGRMAKVCLQNGSLVEVEEARNRICTGLAASIAHSEVKCEAGHSKQGHIQHCSIAKPVPTTNWMPSHQALWCKCFINGTCYAKQCVWWRQVPQQFEILSIKSFHFNLLDVPVVDNNADANVVTAEHIEEKCGICQWKVEGCER